MERLIVPEIVKLSKDATWRVRLATIQFCPLLPKFISAGAFTEHIEPLLKQWMEDTVHSVRVEAVSCGQDLSCWVNTGVLPIHGVLGRQRCS